MNKDNTTFLETNPSVYKEQAKKALQKAKELEQQQLAQGKKTVRINPKTIVLR